MSDSSTSSSPNAEERLITLPLERILPHPANPNLMSADRLDKLARNIEREGRYPPLIVRPLPEQDGCYQLLDGHQRLEVLRRLGHQQALCFPWPCDEATAMVLLATLNRLEGEDVPGKRAELLAELSALLPREELALLLPEDASSIEKTMGLLHLDSAQLLAELDAAARRENTQAVRAVSFAVLAADEGTIEEAVGKAGAKLSGSNKRGRALALICRRYLERQDA